MARTRATVAGSGTLKGHFHCGDGRRCVEGVVRSWQVERLWVHADVASRPERDDPAFAAPRFTEADRGRRGERRRGRPLGLPHEAVALRVGVVVEGRVPVEVVVGDVEQDGDVRAKRVDALHLEARDLEHHHVEALVRGARRPRLPLRGCRRRTRACPPLRAARPRATVTVLLPLVPPDCNHRESRGARHWNASSISPSEWVPLDAFEGGEVGHARRHHDEVESREGGPLRKDLYA